MTQHQHTKHGSVLQHPRPGRLENPGVGSEAVPGRARGEEVSLRVEVPGYGGSALNAVVSAESLAEIERGDRPVDADLKIRVPGYGWRVARVRVLPGKGDGAPAEARPVRMGVTGYGGASSKLVFVRQAR